MITKSITTTAITVPTKRRPRPATSAVANARPAAKKDAISGVVDKLAVVAAKIEVAAESASDSSLLANLVKLRDQGTAYYENVFVPGRNAMQEIMGAVYSQFHAAKSSPTYKDNLKVLSTKLREYGVTVRSTSTDASLFVRMVFKGFDDKQVSIYSRSLAAAYEKGVAPDAFGKFIEDTEGGFYGVVIRTSTGNVVQASDANSAGKVAFQDVQKAKTVETIKDFEWDSSEEHCVLIAIRGLDGDSAALKKIGVSDDLFFSILAKYAAEKKARLKEALSSDVGATKSAMKTFEGERDNVATEIGNLQADMRAAENDGDATEVKRLRDKLKIAMMRRDQTERTLKLLQSEIDAGSKEKAVA